MIFSPEVMVESYLLIAALSLDALVTGFAYGTNRIKIPFYSLIIINIICSTILAVSIITGRVLDIFIGDHEATIICFITLFMLGIIKLFDGIIKSIIMNKNGFNKNLTFSLFSIRFILKVYATPELADQDSSKSLSVMESLSLAVALSLDSIAVGVGVGLQITNILLIVVLSFVVGIFAIRIGGYLGNKLAEKTSLNLSWLSGVLLIVLAFMKYK